LIDGFSTDSECRLGLRGNYNLSPFQCPLADRGEEINHVEAKGFLSTNSTGYKEKSETDDLKTSSSFGV
jgi:hypothetical protein